MMFQLVALGLALAVQFAVADDKTTDVLYYNVYNGKRCDDATQLVAVWPALVASQTCTNLPGGVSVFVECKYRRITVIGGSDCTGPPLVTEDLDHCTQSPYLINDANNQPFSFQGVCAKASTAQVADLDIYTGGKNCSDNSYIGNKAIVSDNTCYVSFPSLAGGNISTVSFYRSEITPDGQYIDYKEYASSDPYCFGNSQTFLLNTQNPGTCLSASQGTLGVKVTFFNGASGLQALAPMTALAVIAAYFVTMF